MSQRRLAQCSLRRCVVSREAVGGLFFIFCQLGDGWQGRRSVPCAVVGKSCAFGAGTSTQPSALTSREKSERRFATAPVDDHHRCLPRPPSGGAAASSPGDRAALGVYRQTLSVACAQAPCSRGTWPRTPTQFPALQRHRCHGARPSLSLDTRPQPKADVGRLRSPTSSGGLTLPKQLVEKNVYQPFAAAPSGMLASLRETFMLSGGAPRSTISG